ncbi:50S ribosomal protein L29, chloroplastic-like [Tripterygium wilfordii]|uniref:50S ribosomal protein L29, chloroplastic-like n=1 Tax=Tripterygium wilfordii TaxID=458696 RepID=UPI0018F8446F|nr:50S ribosomal protein L29, chloroplastic-like [Tripterygium wilfordii]
MLTGSKCTRLSRAKRGRREGKMLSLSMASPTSVTTISPNLKSSFSGITITTRAFPTRLLPQLTQSGRGRSSSLVVMMAKREEELKEIRAKTTEEINEEVVDLKGELFMLRLQKSVRNEFKSSEFGRMRKRVARMLTVRRERELEEGIGKRQSRKLDRLWKKSIVVRPPPSLKKLQEEEAAAEAAVAEKST